MKKAVIKCENGIHARPATQVVSMASTQQGDVFLVKNGKQFNAKSIMQILSMGLVKGDEIEVHAPADESGLLEDELCNLIESADA